MNTETISGLDEERTPDLILVNSPLRNYDERPRDNFEVLPPFGLGYIATQSWSEGHNVGLIDAEHHGIGPSRLAEAVNVLNPRFAGINVLTPSRKQALKFARKLNKNIPLLIGGAHASAMIKRTLKEFTDVHSKVILIPGEAELAVVAFLDGQNPHEIPGAFWLDNEELKWQGDPLLSNDLNKLPFLNREFLANDPSMDSHTGKIESRILTSRGCPFNCSFCSGARDSLGTPVRHRNPSNVAKEISKLTEGNAIESTRFIDDLLISSRKRIKSILEAMDNAGIPIISWDATGRANIISRFDDEFLNYLKTHGAHEIAIGIESASEKLRKRINKQASMAEILKSVKKLTDHNIKVKGYFIIGLPTETKEETMTTINLAKQLTNQYPDQFRGSVFIFRPYPGTQEWNWLIQQGYQENDLLDMHAEGTGKRAKHQVLTTQQFGEYTPQELSNILTKYNRWQNGNF